MKMEIDVPNPGSDEALDMGCTCPVLDNAHGKGWMGEFWITEGCPVHTGTADRDDTDVSQSRVLRR